MKAAFSPQAAKQRLFCRLEVVYGADAFDDYVFNDFERTNVRTLLNREVALTGLSGGMKLDQPGYDIYAVWR